MDAEYLKERSNMIPKVLMVSSAAFGVFSAVNPYMAIPSAIAGMASNLIKDQKAFEQSAELNEELIIATRAALEETYAEIKERDGNTSSQLKIIDELTQEEVQPQNLKSLIKKTESYQTHYCTVKDADNIVRLFENHFRVQVSKSALLSRYYTLAAEVFTAEKIRIVSALLDDNTTTLNQISEMLDDQDAHIKNIEKTGMSIEKKITSFAVLASRILNEFTCIMLAVAVFLGIGIVLSAQYDTSILLAVLLSYGISNLAVASLEKGQYIYPFQIGTDKVSKIKMVFSIVIPLLLPLAVFVLLSYAIAFAKPTYSFAITVFTLLPGSLISMLFRAMKPTKREPSVETITSWISDENDK